MIARTAIQSLAFVAFAGLTATLVVGCGAAPDGQEGSAQAQDLTCTTCNTDPPPTPPTSSVCYSGSYQGDTLQTLSTQGTIPGSVGACATALLNHHCFSVGNPSSTLARPIYTNGGSSYYLAVECAYGTMADINAHPFWGNGSFPKYQGTVWTSFNGSWENAWFDGIDYSNGALYRYVNGAKVFWGYTGSSTWNGWAYNTACNPFPSLNHTFQEDAYYDGYACQVRYSTADEVTEFDPRGCGTTGCTQ